MEIQPVICAVRSWLTTLTTVHPNKRATGEDGFQPLGLRGSRKAKVGSGPLAELTFKPDLALVGFNDLS